MQRRVGDDVCTKHKPSSLSRGRALDVGLAADCGKSTVVPAWTYLPAELPSSFHLLPRSFPCCRANLVIDFLTNSTSFLLYIFKQNVLLSSLRTEKAIENGICKKYTKLMHQLYEEAHDKISRKTRDQ